MQSAHGVAILTAEQKCKENPEERVTVVAMDTGPGPASSSSSAADMEIQLPAMDKRAVGTVEDSEREHAHKERKSARTIGGLEVCVQDDSCDEWLDEPGRMLEDQERVK